MSATNWGEYILGDLDIVDRYRQTAETLGYILLYPGQFMLKLGINEEDLELEQPMIDKICEWLKSPVSE